MVNKASGVSSFQTRESQQSNVGADPVQNKGNLQKPSQELHTRDATTSQQVRTGPSFAPTAEQASQNQGLAIQTQIAAKAAPKRRVGGKRTGALREPRPDQLLRSMSNPEAMRDVLSLKAPLQQLLG